MNDQLALGIGWRQLAKRSQRSNRGTEVGNALAEVATGIAEDVETFRDMMRRLGFRENPVKVLGALASERLGRLKLNGRIVRYSPLSRFDELDFLTMGIEGKKQLWHTLESLADLTTRLPEVDFQHLIDRAEHQRTLLEPHRLQAGKAAFRTQ
ncbi:hypothetical protein ONR57_21785 [Hoyosella sp. YIM 151337]|uniref:hypothetical protein n=1 Tax=Hoyosella sp. YIM 151337 TaxID=2992742 RepID=UPI0022360B19|nr:hypothetical protein [Hoyosella sp. YIM 151337]MCW4355941.1 hypothetical protein [Hoyosella sp. YIM 151337]